MNIKHIKKGNTYNWMVKDGNLGKISNRIIVEEFIFAQLGRNV